MSHLLSTLRRAWIATTIAALVALAGCARQAMKTSDTELQMTKDVDVGLVLDSSRPLQLSIPIKNISGRVITIHQVSKDCSCTSVHVDELKLAPGQSTTVRIVSNLTGKSGQYIGNIVIESDAAEKIDEIQVRGMITGQIRIRPTSATVLMGDQSVSGAFTVYCDDQDGKWKYMGFNSGDPQLAVQLKESKTTPTTSVYEGAIAVDHRAAWKSDTAYCMTTITLKFENERLGRNLEINYPVEIVVRRHVTLDPPQVIFISGGAKQQRTVVAQSAEETKIDAAKSSSPCLQVSLRRIDAKSSLLDLIYIPSSGPEGYPEQLKCDLLSGGRIIGSIPIHLVDIP
jgi:hypothetical protein